VRALLLALALALTTSSAVADEAPHTPVSEVKLAEALLLAHKDVNKKKPKGLRLGVAWSQVALESGRGAHTRGYNIGQIDNGKAKFKTLREGAQAYWKAVNRCKTALAYFDAGDAYGAGKALRVCGYHRTDPEVYAGAMKKLKVDFDRDIWPKIKARFGH
jgi:hypothetical protein